MTQYAGGELFSPVSWRRVYAIPCRALHVTILTWDLGLRYSWPFTGDVYAHPLSALPSVKLAKPRDATQARVYIHTSYCSLGR